MSSSHSVLIVLLIVDVVGIAVLRWIDVRKRPVLYMLLGLFLVPALIPGSLVEAVNELGLAPALQQGWIAAFDFLVLALALVFTLWAGLHLRRTRADPTKPPPRRSGLESDQFPRLTVLTCQSCGAPLPLSTTDQRCPSCGAPYQVPADYARTLALRGEFAVELNQAETTWRRVHRTSSIATPPIYGLSALCAATGLLGLGGASASGLFAGLIFFGVGMYFATLTRHVPPLPKATAEIGRPEVAQCTQCGAPVAFAAHDLCAACRYCGAESYRADFAHAARQAASEREAVAATSLYDAVVELRKRVRSALKLYVALVTAAVFVMTVALSAFLGTTVATVTTIVAFVLAAGALKLFAVF